MKTFNEWRKEKGLKELDTSKIDIEGFQSSEKLSEIHGLSKEVELTEAIAKEIEKEVFTAERIVVPEELDSVEIDLLAEDWQTIKGIGPKLAQRLEENGPYKNMDAVGQEKGVSPKILERIEEFFKRPG